MTLTGTRDSEDNPQRMTWDEFSSLGAFLQNKMTDYLENTDKPKIKDIFNITEAFKPVEIGSDYDSEILLAYIGCIKLYLGNGEIINVNKEGTQYAVIGEQITNMTDFPVIEENGRKTKYIGEHLDMIIEKKGGIEKAVVCWNNF